MNSMTGYGQATSESERYRIAVSLRSVNHRQLDLVLRLREELRRSESSLRDLISGQLARGRVEVTVEVTALQPPRANVEVRRDVVEGLLGAFERLHADGVVSGTVTVADLLALPDVVSVSPGDADWSDQDHEQLVSVVGAGLEELVADRRREGEALQTVLQSGVKALEEHVTQLTERRVAVQQTLAQSLQERLAEVTGDLGIDPDRLAQEVALLVERSDVSEELDRLAAHLEHFESVLQRAGAVGRRLDFVVQEILRELNTLGAKCRDTDMSRRVIDAKLICEQLREQIQNVE